ncbi:sugar phosphate isomerase/epimerase family protein [Amycolatopsis granulosa]|uniref:sugar phosphate isomerase/epimerase family protein n=1 Tax=Amycolatopsis granulosa TaxID=185684 RepID=UPI0014245C76|nr:TIM barrel protein [Amycolatopsis granulosa]NIH88360.1 sugar phosphate isomerase/epimerase [Amycolatopsis granulosa]
MSASSPVPPAGPGAAARRFDLTCSASTLRGAGLSTRLRAAADAGFSGLGLKLGDHRDSGLSESGLRSALEEHGLRILELEHSWDWVEPIPDPAEAELWRLAESVGFRQLNVSMFAEYETTALVDAFGRLCDRAARYGVLVGLEFLPFTAVRTLRYAWEIVRAAGSANAGIVLDVWHWRRSAATLRDLAAVPPERVTSLQLCEARTDALPDLKYEARHHRELPGHGAGAAGGTAAFVAALKEHGIGCPVSVEVFSDDLDALPAARAAAVAAAAGAEVLAAAGWPAGRGWTTNLQRTKEGTG